MPEVKNLAESERAVESRRAASGGYVASSDSSSRNTAYSAYTARIPAERFEAAMEEAGTLGAVRCRSVPSLVLRPGSRRRPVWSLLVPAMEQAADLGK